jgi:hypothetical protein
MGNGEGEPYENFFLWRLGWIDGQKIERRRKLYPAILESSKSSTWWVHTYSTIPVSLLKNDNYCFLQVQFFRTQVLNKNTSLRRGRDLTDNSSLGRYVFGSEISYTKAPPRLPGLGC